MLYKRASFLFGYWLCFHLSTLDAKNEAERQGNISNDFKNMKFLHNNEVPELSLIKPIIDQKYEMLKEFIDAWESIDHENLRISAGK